MPRTRGIHLASVFLFYNLAALVRTLLVDAVLYSVIRRM
jgi:hypothetical protein